MELFVLHAINLISGTLLLKLANNAMMGKFITQVKKFVKTAH
jgi:hypothetical protein